MLFGCNYSKELMALVEEDLSICDYIKIGAFGPTKELLEEAFRAKPLLIHGFGWFERGGMPSVDIMDFDIVNRQLKTYESPFLGMHAMAFEKDLSQNKDVLSHMVQIFKEIQKRLEIPLLIENMDYSKSYDYETTVIETVKPEFISKLIEETNCYLLLDISHALVSAYQLGLDIYDYLNALPLEEVKEIHMTGSFLTNDDGYKDIHGIMNEKDYEIARFLASNDRLIKSGNLQIITLEYGGLLNTNKDAIKHQLSQLKEIFG